MMSVRYARARAVAIGCSIAALAGGAPLSSLAAQSAEPFPGLDSYIDKARQTWKIPGLAVAIVRNDSVLYTKGFGTLSLVNKTPVDDKTLFEIGSSSKAFTATLVAMLVGEGKMSYDAHLSDYLPDFKMYDPVANTQVTVRDALSHRSGIARGELVWLGSGFNREQVLHHVRFLKPESPFRSQWSYQNMMFLAAGEAAGKAAGSSWDELVKTRIFAPLGMTYSQTSSRGMTATNVAIPHGQRKDSVYDEPMFDGYNIGPAGAILSNAHDMAQWLRFQLNDAVVNGKRLIAAPAFHETHTPQAISTLGGGRAAPGDTAEPATHFHTYGFGWFVEDYHHQLRWQHGGNTPGMTTAVGMLPEKHFGVVVLSSMASASLPGILMDYIMDRDLGLPMKDLSAEAFTRTMAQRRRADSASVAQAGAPKGQSSTPLNAFVGTYVDSLYGELTIALDNGTLELTRAQWKGPLQYVNANNWRWITPGDAPLAELPLKFEIAPDNSVTGVYFGLGADATLMMKKSARGGRGGRGGRP